MCNALAEAGNYHHPMDISESSPANKACLISIRTSPIGLAGVTMSSQSLMDVDEEWKIP